MGTMIVDDSVVAVAAARLIVAVHSLSISLGDQLPDWNVAARYRGHCTARPATRVVVRNRCRIVVELLGAPGLLRPQFT